MKIKFEDLGKAAKKENIIPITGRPVQNSDATGAVIEYVTYRNDTLKITVTPDEVSQIEFSKDWKFMKCPDFLEWTKGPKGPYLKHAVTNGIDPADSEW